jgi:hypothetical protein
VRPLLIAAAAAACLTSPVFAAGYDLCAFTAQVMKARAKDFARLRGDMVQPGSSYDMKDGGAEYALNAKPGEDAECGILAAGVDNYGEAVDARIFCRLGAPRPLTDASELYVRTLAELKACMPRATFEQSTFGDLAKPGDPVRWSTAVEDRNFSLVISMSTLPQAGRAPSDGQFTLRYQLWNTAGSTPARRAAAKKAASSRTR